MQLEPDLVALLAVIATALAAVLLVVAVVQGLRLRKLSRTYEAAIGPDAPEDLVSAVADQRAAIGRLREDLTTVHGNTETLRDLQRSAISRIGLVRYDAFPDMGGMLSFSAALLDERGDGVLISAINGRQETRAYGKPLVSGSSQHNLSEEEEAAVKAALDSGRSDALSTPGGKRRRRQ